MVDHTPREGALGTIRAAASALVERSVWLKRAGITFGGKRDLYEVCGYRIELTPEDYRARYRRGGIAARIVEALPDATWRGGGELVEDEDPKTETQFEKGFNELNLRLGIWSAFRRLDILAGLGRYAVLLIGAPGEFDQPLGKFNAKGLMYLQPFAEEDAVITQFEQDPKNPRYGQPLFYNLRRTTVSALGRANFSKRVHWTRCLHVADGLLDDQVYGTPRLERVWNYLDDLDKISGGGAEAFWKRADQGMQININPETKFVPGDKEKLSEQVDEYIHGLRRVLQTRGVDVSTLGSDVATFNGPADAVISLISATTGIPQRILMGSERGELASSQDKMNWDDRVSDRREAYAEPCVVRPFVDRLIEYGVLPEPKEYHARWPDLKDLNDSQRADMALKWSQLNKLQGEVVVKGNEIRDRVLDLEPFTDEEIAAQQAEAQAQAQQAAQTQAVASGKLLPNGAPPPSAAAPTAATQRALAAAIARGRAILHSERFRVAVAQRDRQAVRALLTNATREFEHTLSEIVPQSLS